MQAKRKTIGRTLSATSFSHLANNQEHIQRFILKSGKSAVFHLEHIAADEIEEKTFVRFAVNGRDQRALTPESLIDITRTIKLQQFFPVIGFRANGKIEILDGSRRRAAALICHVGLMILVTESEISSEDARQLAADIQTAKEHNLREVGLRLLQLREKGYSQKDIAKIENLSESKVTRAIQAASAPDDLVALFPVQAELNYSDYKLLLNIEQIIQTHNLLRNDIFEYVNEHVAHLISTNQIASDELKKEILYALKDITDNLSAKNQRNLATVSPLWAFEDKNTYARKRMKGRGFSYEFNRVPKELQELLDSKINEILTRFYENM